MEAPIHVSNVMVVDPSNGEATRVGYKEVDGKKSAFLRKPEKFLINNLMKEGGANR